MSGSGNLITYDADLLKIRAENATFNGILIGSAVMTEILVCRFDAVSGPGTVPGPETASNLQTSISVVAQSSTETPPDSSVGQTVRSNGFGRAI